MDIPDAGPSRILTPSPEMPPPSHTALLLPLANQTRRMSMMVPREVPPSPDRQSAHYPGFDVFRDTHVELPSSLSSLPLAGKQLEEDDCKENIPPRKIAKKISSLPTEDMIESGFSSTCFGPRNQSDSDAYDGLPTPKGHSLGRKKASHHVQNSSPSKPSHLTAGRFPPSAKKSIAEARRLLEREVDEPECILSDEEDL